ncbi:recombinase family protein [Tardiphaga sp. vice304]|uniref:recombinase family protein n=1 Tax=Tardiphaga sp. vice304 TaxID=2592817 RepID=UPI00116304CA|nr:recombinase family protein [Tardiphaga sp. vice304]QDM25918.1 recombinase family protein [Tardiphaga sp. vice304]
MASSPIKPLRCAIYTRKSTEHGLDLEFNSLDAQRDSCEAYIKSQASQGWRALAERYDDPAYSGGNLDRPALQRLLKDVDAGKVDVIVVYKIDRLTRSLADFAKLVVAFDAKSISFVAVTQQFNTTSSMGRLTLNVLLSFAQFERELSSERVRDKIAASRRKGKWTGGTVPLGYRAVNKKLVIDKDEAETVRTIFKRYLELESFAKLVADLNARGIVTKRRTTRVAKYNGGIPFTYGPLAHFLKNRVYVGETGHKDKWFPGEHQPIVDLKVFDAVQALLRSNSIRRKASQTASEALLMGKLYDDRGNRMTPSFSAKNGVRYRFYVSSALLRGRKAEVGSLGRVPAQEIEDYVLAALPSRTPTGAILQADSRAALQLVDRIIVSRSEVLIKMASPDDLQAAGHTPGDIALPWQSRTTGSSSLIENHNTDNWKPDESLIQSMVRARHWLRTLQDGAYDTIENLAAAQNIHPKVVRQELRLAFLSPSLVSAILDGTQPTDIKRQHAWKTLPLAWIGQRPLLR